MSTTRVLLITRHYRRGPARSRKGTERQIIFFTFANHHPASISCTISVTLRGIWSPLRSIQPHITTTLSPIRTRFFTCLFFIVINDFVVGVIHLLTAAFRAFLPAG